MIKKAMQLTFAIMPLKTIWKVDSSEETPYDVALLAIPMAEGVSNPRFLNSGGMRARPATCNRHLPVFGFLPFQSAYHMSRLLYPVAPSWPRWVMQQLKSRIIEVAPRVHAGIVPTVTTQ